MGNKPQIRVDKDFYELWKRSGYSSPTFTKKIYQELFIKEEKVRKQKKEGWMFKI